MSQGAESPSQRTSASNAVDRDGMMWGGDADEGEFGTIWPLWYAEDHAARDRRATVKRLRALADRDYAPGHFGLAAACRDGAGVRRDGALSLRHFLAAAEQGHPSAEGMLGNLVLRDELAARLDGAQRAVVDARVAELKAKLPLP